MDDPSNITEDDFLSAVTEITGIVRNGYAEQIRFRIKGIVPNGYVEQVPFRIKGIVPNGYAEQVPFRILEECGDIFEDNDAFSGLTLTVEASSKEHAIAMVHAIQAMRPEGGAA